MREKIQHRVWIVVLLVLAVGGITLLLNNISFNPDFSVMDAMSGATKHSQKNESAREVISSWSYTWEDLALADADAYSEILVSIGKVEYRLLVNNRQKNQSKYAVLLTNKENTAYQNAVKQVASYLQDEGYEIRIKECTETMMLSFFVMDEEVQQ